MIKHTVGIDISKDYLDAYSAPEGRTARFGNDKSGFRRLLAWIDARVERIAYEPTGPWHRSFEETLLEAGLPLYSINPYQVRCFARSQGRRAKTDQVDARMLALMAATHDDLRPVRPRSQVLRDLTELHGVREALVEARLAVKARSEQLRHVLAKRFNREQLRQIERQLRTIEGAIRALLRQDADLARKAEILNSVPGLGEVSAVALLALMPELGDLSGKAAASLAGLAPITRESGAWSGKAFIQGGRHNLRRALYMPALTASRWNPDLKRKYEALRANGKPKKVAIIAIMRKLVVLANALVQQDRLWTPRERLALA